jgi:hypothetical protein
VTGTGVFLANCLTILALWLGFGPAAVAQSYPSRQMTAPKRLTSLPDVPTIAESGVAAKSSLRGSACSFTQRRRTTS